MPKLAVIIPCFNEEVAIGRVVADFRAALPRAIVFVYDNNSTDRTAAAAATAGAVVREARLRGKGHVIRRMFADVDADIYVLVDGNDTYDAAAAPKMVDLLTSRGLDMVNGARASNGGVTHRRGRRMGNAMLTGIVARIFGAHLNDMLSGYRVFSRRFVKSFPALATGFETGTEFTIHALELRMPMAEVRTTYRDRPEGSASKLRAYTDGFRILRTIAMLVKEERPLQFFGLCAALLLAASLALGLPVVLEFARTHLVPRLPTAILATGCVLLAMMALMCGLILDSVTRGRREMKQLAYLAVPPLPMDDV